MSASGSKVFGRYLPITVGQSQILASISLPV